MRDSSWAPFSFLSNLECANPPDAMVEVLSLPGKLVHAFLSAVLSQCGDSFTPLRSAPFPGALYCGGVPPLRAVTVCLPPSLFPEGSAAWECLEKVSYKLHSVPRAAPGAASTVLWYQGKAFATNLRLSSCKFSVKLEPFLTARLIPPCKTWESLPGLGFRVYQGAVPPALGALHWDSWSLIRK